MKNISTFSRIALAVSVIPVVLCYFLPLWRIELWAPQYPEGLAMTIWYNNLGGDVEIINGLNHYIGMKHIKVEMFPEFGYLKFIIAGFMVWGLFVAFMGSLRWLKIYVVTLVLGGIIAMADFYKWGYDYGHNLDPTAPIQVQGMAYQPPLLGYKNLLNFTALSIPDSGGWLIVVAGVVGVLLLVFELYKHRKNNKQTIGSQLIAAVLLLSFVACNSSSEPEPINYGSDACHFCKMTLMDTKFGAEIISKKGKVFKFDDLNCTLNFMKKGDLKAEDMAAVYVIDYAQLGKFVTADQAFFLKTDKVRTPMASGILAFEKKEDCLKAQADYGGVCQTWQNLTTGNLNQSEHEHTH